MSVDPKTLVTGWWVAGCDYDEGINLYIQFGKNKTLKNVMPGRPSRYTEKLRYELCKDVGLNWLSMPAHTGQRPVQRITVSAAKKQDPGIEQHVEPQRENTDQYPPLVRRVISEYAECYRERSMIHQQMCSVPEINSEDHCKKRAALLKSVKDLSLRMDDLYYARQAYFDHKEIPDEMILWPGETKTEDANVLPNDIERLKVMKKNQQVALFKDRNMLDFQQHTKCDIKNPMPDGPRRKGIEKRIAWRRKRIEEIEYKIVELT